MKLNEELDCGMSADKFVEWRRRLNLTQIEAAALLGVSERTIAYYESGTRALSISQHIACLSYEEWPWLREQIDNIISTLAKKSIK